MEELLVKQKIKYNYNSGIFKYANYGNNIIGKFKIQMTEEDLKMMKPKQNGILQEKEKYMEMLYMLL